MKTAAAIAVKRRALSSERAAGSISLPPYLSGVPLIYHKNIERQGAHFNQSCSTWGVVSAGGDGGAGGRGGSGGACGSAGQAAEERCGGSRRSRGSDRRCREE